MCDAKLKTVLSLFSPVASKLDALSSNGPATDANCVKLNTNENPFPLPKSVMQSAIAAIEHQYLYPEDDNLSLRAAASDTYGFSKDQVIAGNGSSELLGLIYRAFLAPGDRVAMLSPGFSFNRKLAMLQGAEFLEIASSEAHAAAGVRVGFGFGHPEIIGRLRNIQNVFNMNVIGQAVGKSILAHRHAYEENHRHIKHERQRVTLALLQLGFSVTPSHANFLLARVPAGQEGSCWQAALKEQKILIASFPDIDLKNCIRVSIGTTEQMDKFLAAAKNVCMNV
ncbi:MAG: histidinol-phosphate aminotransferase family protein [Mesorhizobium sp.]|nr:MAG: histidinol-phosphate aminotransferase family protein [Mesorhizobium sp.]